MRCFVTGGSGFIGRRVVRLLVDRGHEVFCLSRSGQSSAQLAKIGVEVIGGNLQDADSIRSALAESNPTHVAHLAAEPQTLRDRNRLMSVNVEGTRAVVEACRDRELERFVFLSTVVRGMAHGQTFTEDDAIPATTEYGKSKERAEQIVLSAREDWGLPVVTLRPSRVYGAGGWFAELFHDRLFRIPGDGENVWDVVHVDDVAGATVLLLESAPAGEIYHVVDDTPITLKQFWERVAEAAGRRPYKHIPVWAAKLARGTGPVTAVIRSAHSSNAKLRSLGWKPQYPNSLEALPAVIAKLSEPDTASAGG